MNSILGHNVYISPDIPRMTLSAELIPGVVRWPPGFKAEIDAWMLGFFGTTNLVPDGQVYKTPQGIHCNPRTFQNLKAPQP